MPPIIHCVRHAQGYHNVGVANHLILDPLLTPLGEKQCRVLRDEFPYHSRVELVTASPLRRTLYTALLSFEPVFKLHKGMNLIALPEAQETSDVPCDTGSELEFLKQEFEDKNLPVDLSFMPEGWNSKIEKWAPTPVALKRRARELRRWLKARPEREIVLVTHGGFLHYFTEDWEDSSLYQGTGWLNTEFRTYQFTDAIDTADFEGKLIGGDNATIIERPESRMRRGKLALEPTREQQRALYRQALAAWDGQRLQLSLDEKEMVEIPEGKEVKGVRI